MEMSSRPVAGASDDPARGPDAKKIEHRMCQSRGKQDLRENAREYRVFCVREGRQISGSEAFRRCYPQHALRLATTEAMLMLEKVFFFDLESLHHAPQRCSVDA